MVYTEKKQIKSEVLGQGRIISDGTLKTENILKNIRSFLSFAKNNLTDANTGVTLDKLDTIIYEIDTILNFKTYVDDRHDGFDSTLKSSLRREMDYFLNDDVIPFLDDMLPPTYYYGCQDGDGACFGIFQENYREEEL